MIVIAAGCYGLYHITLAKFYGDILKYKKPGFFSWVLAFGIIGLGIAFVLAGRIELIEFSKEVPSPSSIL